MVHSSARLLLLCAIVTGCSSGTAPTARPATAPALLTPQAGVPIRQNDSTTGCPFSPTGGYGFSVDFTWSTVPGATAYHLVMHHVGSLYANIDTVVTGQSLQVTECNSYVIDANLYDWHWTVAARSAEADDGPWAAEGVYEFAPMGFPPLP